jgi:hypothetical protein
MDLPESDVQSFIVKLWFEPSETKDAPRVRWHGQITHVPSGERRYLKELGEIIAFIEPYLRAAGVEPTRAHPRLRRWLRLRL